MPHLALVVIHSNAVVPGGGDLDYGSYDLFVPPKLDDRVDREIQRGLREAIVNARLKARSLDQATIDAMVNIPSVRSVTVTPENQRMTVRGMNFLFPIAFGLLLFMGVMGGGGQLLTTMVEEKSNRVVEVLLSAVSPMELMAGKLLGQMAASLLGMCIYLAMGLSMLSFFALLGLLNVSLIFYLITFLHHYLSCDGIADDGGGRGGQRHEGSAGTAGAFDDPLYNSVDALDADIGGSQLDIERDDELSAARQHLRHASADGIQRAASPLASMAFDCHWSRIGLLRAVGGGESLPDRPFDVRQTPEFRYSYSLDPCGIMQIKA